MNMNFNTSSLNLAITPYVVGVNPPVTKPNPVFLTDIGEEEMRDLFRRFYTKLYESPIRDIFPLNREEMMIASQHSADFFIQICGGPQYFNQNRGAPQMRGRHAPFRITPQGRIHWLKTFEEALKPIIDHKKTSEANIQSFWNYIDIFSQWMVNTQD